jgi:hypothetical protein
VKTLRRLQKERDLLLRSQLIEMGRKALLKWFAMGAPNLLRGVLPVNKVTERFINSHRQELSTIADKNADEGELKKAILKRGGAGFLGGTIIRHLFKWETQKKKRVPLLRIRVPDKVPPLRMRIPAKVSPPLRIRLPPLRKYPRFVYAYHLRRDHPRRNHPRGNHPLKKLIVKFPFGKMKKSPKKSKKSMMVRIPLEKLRSVTPVKKTKTLADLKFGLAQKKMERAMRGPIWSSRTSDTGGFTLGNVTPFTPLAASTPRTKHQCSQCGAEFNMKSNLHHHLKTVHQGDWPRRLLNLVSKGRAPGQGLHYDSMAQ